MQLRRWEKRARRRLFMHPQRARMTYKDWVVMLALTAVYAVAAFTNLGSHDIPKTFYTMQSADDEIVVEFENSEQIETIKYYASYGTGMISLFYSEDGEGWMPLTQQTLSEEVDEDGNPVWVDEHTVIDHFDERNMYEWQFVPAPFEGKYVLLRIDEPGLQVKEMGFCGSDGLPVSIASAKNENPQAPRGNPVSKMFDEQLHVPVRTYYMNEMYFDEVYHARTAYEHVQHMYPYETTHPPLGKILISVGIRIFGMNPFGWRFMGALFGVLMLPLMYVFAKRMFKRTLFAFIPTFLFATDFMHYTQTRIATIDSYSVFFIMLMYLFMYLFWEQNYNRQPLYKTLIPLALCGIAFGLGAATKWLCLYAGVGLALLFFYQMAKRYQEYRYARQELINDERKRNALAGDSSRILLRDGCADDMPVMMDEKKRAYLEDICLGYFKQTAVILLWCVLFFIIVPLIIYYLSYIPHMNIAENPYDFQKILDNQVGMFNYHSKLVVDEPHAFASTWYEWPYIKRPVFLFMGQGYPDGWMSSMSTMGNPAVWWGGLLAVLALIIIRINRGPFGKRALFISVAALSQYAPWIIIPRETYIYHYFATVPFLILLVGLLFKFIIESTENMPAREVRVFRSNANFTWRPDLAGKIPIYVYLAICLVLFVMFYPITTGVPVLRAYSDIFLRWMDTWPFY